jgi:hypothetical protein
MRFPKIGGLKEGSSSASSREAQQASDLLGVPGGTRPSPVPGLVEALGDVT